MRTFVVLGLVFSIPVQEIGLGKRFRNAIFCVEWDVEPQLKQSVNLPEVSTRPGAESDVSRCVIG